MLRGNDNQKMKYLQLHAGVRVLFALMLVAMIGAMCFNNVAYAGNVSAGASSSAVTALAAGCASSVALKGDGTVWAWGYNASGDLGDGTTNDRYTPVQVSGLTGVTAIAAGGYVSGNSGTCSSGYTLALKGDGTVWAWGYNGDYELGDGTTTNRLLAVQVSGLIGVTAIAAGANHAVAMKGDGTVWAWGVNNVGQLGDGTTINRKTAVQVISSDVSGLFNGVTAIAAGYGHTIVLKGDGTVWAWGWNGEGQLGDGTTTNRSLPVQVNGLSGVTAIAAGSHYSVALKGDGTVWAWGYNGHGELGVGTTTNSNKPVQSIGLTGVTSIAAGGHTYDPTHELNNHTVALKGDGTVWAWGGNVLGQLGDATNTDKNFPVQVHALTGVTAISAGDWHTLAVKNDGTVWAWGGNSNGQLGDGTTTSENIRVQVSFPASCYNTIAPTSKNFPSSGGSDSVAVNTSGSTCTWAATSSANWIMVSSGSSGTGNGTVTYAVAANTGTSQRTGTMMIAGQPFNVTQDGTNPTPTTYTVTASLNGTGGTISCSPSTNISSGGTSTCTITPSSGYSLSTLTDNNANVLSQVVSNTYTITNITANHTVVATFSTNPTPTTYTVTASVNGTGG
ncbi:MAG: hypothetical protein HQL03_15520, partial [Nitrospirae bacterium]|nr:hypothetical protein [Nitrospirota bacterium]